MSKYNKIKYLTPKMEEARKLVDSISSNTGKPPSYNVIARKLNIDHSAAYYRLRGYRDKMNSKIL